MASVLSSEFKKGADLSLHVELRNMPEETQWLIHGPEKQPCGSKWGKVGRTQGNSYFTVVGSGGPAKLSNFIPKAMGSFGGNQILESLEGICHIFSSSVPSHCGVT